MRKALLILLVSFGITSCSLWFGKVEEHFRMCPIVKIQDTLLFQRTGVNTGFRIEIIGFDGFCYVDEVSGLNKAVINPIIKISKSENTDETDAHFAFYTETVKGPPEFLGVRTTHTSVSIPEHLSEVIFRPNPVERVIPHDLEAEYDLYIGLIISPKEEANIRRGLHKRSMR